MPIYSRNSVGAGAMYVSANESYGYTDIGRILYESVQNDQIVFNAVMAHDFKEAAAIREGTMVASELQSFREFSAKEAWGGLKAKLQKAWEKIKGVFRVVYSKLGVWFVRNGKAFVAMNRKIIANKRDLSSVKIPLYLERKNGKYEDKIDNLISDVDGTINKNKGGNYYAGTINADNQLLAQLQHVAPDCNSVDDFNKAFHDYAFTEKKNITFGDINKGPEYFFNIITGKGDSLKKLRDAEKKADKKLRECMRAIDKAANAKENEGDVAQRRYKNASAVVGSLERAITMTTRATIAAVKAEVSNARQIVGKLVAHTPTDESALLEQMAWMEGSDDVASMEDIDPKDINAPDVAEDADIKIEIDNSGDCE